MAQRYIFVNNAINDSIIKYYQSKGNPNSLEFNSFLVTVMRMIVLLYGELDITNCYHTKNEKGMGGFDTNMTKYGYPQAELEKFKVNFEKYYEFDMKQSKLHIKRKNPYFNRVQKNLIDMMFAKNKRSPLDGRQAQNFYNLLFTSNSNDFYRKTYAYLMAKNPHEVDRYFKKNMYLMSNKLSFEPIRKRIMSKDIYDLLDIKMEDLNSVSQVQIDRVNKQIFDYFKVDMNDPEREPKLVEAITTAKKRPVIRVR